MSLAPVDNRPYPVFLKNGALYFVDEYGTPQYLELDDRQSIHVNGPVFSSSGLTYAIQTIQTRLTQLEDGDQMLQQVKNELKVFKEELQAAIDRFEAKGQNPTEVIVRIKALVNQKI